MTLRERYREARPKLEKGTTVAEYVVILALFAMVVIGAVAFIEQKLDNSFQAVNNELANPPGY